MKSRRGSVSTYLTGSAFRIGRYITMTLATSHIIISIRSKRWSCPEKAEKTFLIRNFSDKGTTVVYPSYRGNALDTFIPQGNLTRIGKIPAGCHCYFQESIPCLLNYDWFLFIIYSFTIVCIFTVIAWGY